MESYEVVNTYKTSIIAPNEVQTLPACIILRGGESYITSLPHRMKEKNLDEIVLKGMGGAISNTVTVAELIKSKIENLHQLTEIGSTDTNQIYDPLYEGLERQEVHLSLSYMHIRLSKVPLDSTLLGYQGPDAPSDVQSFRLWNTNGRGKNAVFRGGKRGRGGKGRIGHQEQESGENEQQFFNPRQRRNDAADENDKEPKLETKPWSELAPSAAQEKGDDTKEETPDEALESEFPSREGRKSRDGNDSGRGRKPGKRGRGGRGRGRGGRGGRGGKYQKDFDVSKKSTSTTDSEK